MAGRHEALRRFPGSACREKEVDINELGSYLPLAPGDEASRVLDIPLGTVKTNVLRGREKLKKMLSAWGSN